MGGIPNEIIRQISDRCDIVEVIAAYVPLKRAGRNYKACCPFHKEKTPSFVVNPDKQIFHCFGCGAGGNAISFIIQEENVAFLEAVRILAQKFGINIPEESPPVGSNVSLQQQIKKLNDLALRFFHKNLISNRSDAAKNARIYLKSRGIDLEAVKTFQLGFALSEWESLISFLRKQNFSLSLMEKAGLIVGKNDGKGYYDRFRNRIIFPIFDIKKQGVAFGARTLKENDGAKYINSPETPVYTKGNHLYGFHLAKEAVRQQDAVIVVEGYLDFIVPFQAGVHNLVASLGTALTIDQIRLIRRYTKNVFLLFDSDMAGESAMVRSLDLLIEEGLNVKIASLTDKHDPDSYVRHYGVNKFMERILCAEPIFDFKLAYLENKHSSTSIEDRAKISEEMLFTIDKYKNAIIKSEYVKKLSQSLRISYEALATELKKVSQKTPSSGLGNQKKDRFSNIMDQLHPLERDILKLMLTDKEFISLTKEEVRPQDFKNIYIQKIVSKIYELFDQGVEVNATDLMNLFEEKKVLQIIAGSMSSNVFLDSRKERIHRDCLLRLRQNRKKSQRQEILKQMEFAQNAGDQQKLEKLTQEFNQLIKEVK